MSSCKACNSLGKAYNKIASSNSLNADITFTEFDCYQNAKFCKKMNVTSYPQVHFFADNRTYVFDPKQYSHTNLTFWLQTVSGETLP